MDEILDVGSNTRVVFDLEKHLTLDQVYFILLKEKVFLYHFDFMLLINM